MFGQPSKVKPRAVSKDLELYDLCGYRIPQGRSSKPVGPDRKVYFKGNLGKRSTSVPLNPAASSQQHLSPEEKTKEMKKHFKKGFTSGWYDSRGEGVQAKGPSLTDFQRAMQQHRETQACIPGFGGKKQQNQSATNPITGQPADSRNSNCLPDILSIPRSIGRSEDWENDYKNLYTTTTANNGGPPSSSAVLSSSAVPNGGIISSTVFGTMQVDSPEKLQRMKDITQENIMKTRRLRAGIPEPVEGIQEASQKAFKREAKTIKKAGKEANSNTQEITDLVPTSTVGGKVSILSAYPYERQLQGRKMRDARRMEDELAKAMAKLNPTEVEKSVPKYRSTSRAASNFSPMGVMY